MSLLEMTYTMEKYDDQHREEMNLRVYRDYWLTIPRIRGGFKTWLDYGEGRFLNLPDCTRDQLDSQLVTYVPDGQRKPFRVIFVNGRLVFKSNGRAVTTRNHEDTIYVLSPKWKFYVHRKINMIFHHSSFMSGGDVYCAGHLHVNDGWLKSLSHTSGHYKPTMANFELLKGFLRRNYVDLTYVRMM